MKIIKTLVLAAFVLCTYPVSNFAQDDRQLLSVEEYQEAVYASWLGQIVGNTYGLCYEFTFIEDPGPDKFPYGYTWTLDLLRKYDGAFSDDDTDIEYMYLTQMEKHGIEPGYYHLAEAWKAHVKERVWCANRAALTLMHAGHYPPVTGSMGYNPQWCQIDPQLVNEIWAVTAPGMIDYAVQKSAFAARITNDSFGIEPTLHYAAMYSAAFFEKDIGKLINIGTAALPEGARFAGIVEHVKKLYREYPDDWQTARRIVKENYLVYADYNKYTWPPIDANLNGAYGIMALLYGQGDFQKTLDYSCAFGMDADNQAATMCGLLGVVYGIDAIPKDLLYPLKDVDWTQPFNDLYKMVTREGLADATISSMAARIATQGEKVILAQGGEIVQVDDKAYYHINETASFAVPFELNPFPPFYAEVNQHFIYPIYTGISPEELTLSVQGNLPPGIVVTDALIRGVPTQAGKYNFTVTATAGGISKSQPAHLTVHTANIAGKATEVLFNKNAIDQNIEIIRDGSSETTYYSTKKDDSREIDFYGYRWDAPVAISAISFNTGLPQEWCGWFTSFALEYWQDDAWVAIEDYQMTPEMNIDNSQWLKGSFIDYEVSFPTVKTTAIRISGLAGGVEKDAANAHLGMQYFTAISELRVYER